MPSAPHWATRLTPLVVPARREDLVVEHLDEQVILSDPVDARVVHINDTAHLVWQWCDGQHTTHQIAQRLTQFYDITFDAALDDVEQLVSSFASANLFQTRGPGG